jgi:hypothetical protein
MTPGDWRPDRTAGVYTRRAGEMTLIEGYLDVYQTNGVGAYIWSLCGGSYTVDEMAQLVADRYQISIERATNSVCCFVEELRRHGFVR